MVILQKLWWWLFTQTFLRIRIPRIGYSSYVASPLFILNGRRIRIGRRVRIFPGVRMEVHAGGGIRICENVSIGQHFHITSAERELVVGADTTISGNAFITNIDHEYREPNRHIMEQKFLVKHTAVGENCFIGYGAAIQAGTILGRQCVVGANSVVRGEFPDYCVIVGAPARIVKRYDPERKGWFRTNPQGEFVS